MPSVSVVIPAYQAEKYLAEAIDSVLGQGWPDLELVVVDDGATDATAAVAAAYGDRLVLVRQANQGLAAARNNGIARCSGELLAFCDADDRWPPGRLAAAVQALEERGVDGVHGLVRQFLSPELERSVRLPDAPVSGLLASALVIRRSAFEVVGPFPDSKTPDVAWALAAQRSPVRIEPIDVVVLERRVHGANLGLTQAADGHHARLQALKQHLDARRAAADPPGPPAPS